MAAGGGRWQQAGVGLGPAVTAHTAGTALAVATDKAVLSPCLSQRAIGLKPGVALKRGGLGARTALW